MVVTAAIASATSWTMGRLGTDAGRSRFDNVHRLVVRQLAVVWDDTKARHELLVTLSGEAEMLVELRDASGDLIDTAGSVCPARVDAWPAVRRNGHKIGTIDLCVPATNTSRIYLGLVLGLVFLWWGAGMFARWIAQPLEEVARVAESVSLGNLDVRIERASSLAPWHRDVQLVAETLADMSSQVARQLREQREMMAAVSHELRTPLGHLRLLVEQFRHEDPLSDDQIKRINQCEREVLDIDGLVGELLANARLEFRELRHDPVSLVEQAIEVLERLGLDPTLLDVEGDDDNVVGDATLLQRALSNLLDNARRHGHGVKMLRIRSASGLVRAEVEDDGPGFDEGAAERAFEPFHGAGHRSDNLGLGLHLVGRIAKAHGGRAYAGNGLQRGAVVGIELPHTSGKPA